MKRFQFRLRHLLGLREQNEELKKLEVGIAARRCDELRLSIEDTKAKQRGTPWDLRDPRLLYAREAYVKRLTKERERHEADLITAEKNRMSALASYNRAHQEAEILRKLRERQIQDYRLEIQHSEDTNMDDIVQSHRNYNLGMEGRH